MNWDWLAGLIEARGTFRWNGSTFQVAVTSTNHELCDKICATFGGIVRRVRHGKESIWRVNGDEALRIMEVLEPMLTEKRKGDIAKAYEQKAKLL